MASKDQPEQSSAEDRPEQADKEGSTNDQPEQNTSNHQAEDEKAPEGASLKEEAESDDSLSPSSPPAQLDSPPQVPSLSTTVVPEVPQSALSPNGFGYSEADYWYPEDGYQDYSWNDGPDYY